MKRGEKTLLCMLGGVVLYGLATNAPAISPDNPYNAITTRNVFGLKPPPPPPPDPASIKPPAPKLFLTGITTILGNKRALLKGTYSPAAGEPAKEQFLMLGEGQRDGNVEVIKIDEKASLVTVDDFGTVTNITFEAPGKAGAPGGTPGAPPAVGAAPPPTGMPTPASLQRSIPMPLRQVRQNNTAVPGQESPGSTAGTPTPATTAYVPPQPQQPAVPGMSMEEQELMIEAQRQTLKAQGAPEHAIFPPTSMTEAIDAEAQGADTPSTPGSVPAPTYQIPGRPPGIPPF
jgi:hypothetical protein